ncbi:helix-turn-helix domain-containing protein [Saccharophagus degradans]|uniref:helix-turn-helix domain-containing protein n=1 Tax=Saccharophagus degradans TaxID=86304 RepID=UPI001C0A5B46|nr:helix-turn-helix domain-containing protein [Saccharophagus degradans]MBU2986881.1 helix-turn-helix domain-containing protein [Saccharophagus degradans]
MLEFYQKALISLVCSVLCSAITFAVCIYLSYLRVSLLPLESSAIPWRLEALSDSELNGQSRIHFDDVTDEIKYTYTLVDAIPYPFVGPKIVFQPEAGANEYVDLSRYSEISFRSWCEKANVMTFHLHSFDENVTTADRFLSYRIAEKDFTCSAKESKTVIDLRHLIVPVWWLNAEKRAATEREYWLDKTHSFSFDNDNRGELNKKLEAYFTDIVLHGRNWYYPWAGGAVLATYWVLYIIYLFRLYKNTVYHSVTSRVKNNKPYIAYQQLTIEPHKNKEKDQLLRFMAAEFSNPNMCMDYTLKKMGMNKNKINAILKSELGMSFIAYINKLRLSEAAIQLSNNENKSISEVAYSVGYNNISYFNRLFKEEYGCTPKMFKGVYKGKEIGGSSD